MTGRLGLIFASYLLLAASSAAAGPSAQVCETRVNDTAAKVLECIRRDSLWTHLKAFQKIADQNPNREGHASRNIGTSGYKASVDYVTTLMRRAGYRVTIQPYKWTRFDVIGTPLFEVGGRGYQTGRDWSVARLSANGSLTALVQPIGRTEAAPQAGNGCSPDSFEGFARGHVALMQRGTCDFDTQVDNARAAGATAAIVYGGARNSAVRDGGGRDDAEPLAARLSRPAHIPVLAVSDVIGAALAREFAKGHASAIHLDVNARRRSDIDYNVIADSPYGDPDRVVVVDAHLDSIHGAGMLDNASGSTTILETALTMARTKTRNRLRYIWFGGEEIGLLGSRYYTKTLDRKELKRIVFDIDVDVTATPNFDVLIADPARAHNVDKYPPNVVPRSRIGNRDFAAYFGSVGIPSKNAWFGNDGTDSNSFSLAGVPNSGILTQQDCCKKNWEVKIWGGFRGNYEGKVPGFNGGCVDWPRRWCDNLSNNDSSVLKFVSRAVAFVVLELANDKTLKHG